MHVWGSEQFRKIYLLNYRNEDAMTYKRTETRAPDCDIPFSIVKV